MRGPWLKIALALVLCAGLILPALALAQDEDPGAIYRRTTHVTFGEGDVIEVDIVRPDADIYRFRKLGNRQSLIRLREDWTREVLSSASGA